MNEQSITVSHTHDDKETLICWSSDYFNLVLAIYEMLVVTRCPADDQGPTLLLHFSE